MTVNNSVKPYLLNQVVSSNGVINFLSPDEKKSGIAKAGSIDRATLSNRITSTMSSDERSALLLLLRQSCKEVKLNNSWWEAFKQGWSNLTGKISPDFPRALELEAHLVHKLTSDNVLPDDANIESADSKKEAEQIIKKMEKLRHVIKTYSSLDAVTTAAGTSNAMTTLNDEVKAQTAANPLKAMDKKIRDAVIGDASLADILNSDTLHGIADLNYIRLDTWNTSIPQFQKNLTELKDLLKQYDFDDEEIDKIDQLIEVLGELKKDAFEGDDEVHVYNLSGSPKEQAAERIQKNLPKIRGLYDDVYKMGAAAAKRYDVGFSFSETRSSFEADYSEQFHNLLVKKHELFDAQNELDLLPSELNADALPTSKLNPQLNKDMGLVVSNTLSIIGRNKNNLSPFYLQINKIIASVNSFLGMTIPNINRNNQDAVITSLNKALGTLNAAQDSGKEKSTSSSSSDEGNSITEKQEKIKALTIEIWQLEGMSKKHADEKYTALELDQKDFNRFAEHSRSIVQGPQDMTTGSGRSMNLGAERGNLIQ